MNQTVEIEPQPRIDTLVRRPGGVSVLLRAAADTGAIVDAAAVFTDDPSGAPVTWIQVHLRGHLGWPAAVGYQIVALTSPDAAL